MLDHVPETAAIRHDRIKWRPSLCHRKLSWHVQLNYELASANNLGCNTQLLISNLLYLKTPLWYARFNQPCIPEAETLSNQPLTRFPIHHGKKYFFQRTASCFRINIFEASGCFYHTFEQDDNLITYFHDISHNVAG